MVTKTTNPTVRFLAKRKYELLLVGLLQHLFVGIFLRDLPFYTRVIWPINMLLLGVLSVGIFMGKGRGKNLVRNLLFGLVLLLSTSVPFVHQLPLFMEWLSGLYVVFFVFIFWEVMRFLIRPGYINADIISASACGYMLLLETVVFLMQTLFYRNPLALKGVDTSGPAATYMDIVYFCTITLTSIGFGDITPGAHYTKLLTAVFGIAGQFYSVVLVGILISKFSANTTS